MNLRPSGYEPDELPDCSTPHLKGRAFYTNASQWKVDSPRWSPCLGTRSKSLAMLDP